MLTNQLASNHPYHSSGRVEDEDGISYRTFKVAIIEMIKGDQRSQKTLTGAKSDVATRESGGKWEDPSWGGGGVLHSDKLSGKADIGTVV